MIDATPLFPEGFHPADESFVESFEKRCKPLRRCDVPSVRYYLVDFGISMSFAQTVGPRLTTSFHGIDRDVPEFAIDEPYDPFPVDIFILGNLFRKKFLTVRLYFFIIAATSTHDKLDI